MGDERADRIYRAVRSGQWGREEIAAYLAEWETHHDAERDGEPIEIGPNAACPTCGACPGGAVCKCEDKRCPCWFAHLARPASPSSDTEAGR
jgi:hypothetical protein